MNLNIKLPWKSKNFKAKSKASLIVMKTIMMIVVFMMMKMGDEIENKEPTKVGILQRRLFLYNHDEDHKGGKPRTSAWD